MTLTRTHLSLLGAILFLVSLSCSAGAAFARTTSSTPPGVHVDPGSPAAKEYSIPLSTARGQPSGSSSSGQLFGNGITKQKSGTTHPSSTTTATATTTTTTTTESVTTPAVVHPVPTPVAPVPTEATPAPPTPTTTSSHPKTPTHRQHHRTTTKRGHRHAVAVVAPTRRPPAHHPAAAAVPAPTKVLHPSSDSGWLWMVLVAVAVLAIGGIAGVALSRGHARTADPGLN